LVVTPATAKQNQATGQKSSKIVSLLRVVRTMAITGMLTGTSTKTAKEVKDDLITIVRGGGTAGLPVTLSYDGDSLSGIIEKIAFNHKPSDEPDVSSDKPRYADYVKYTVQITFIEGVPA